MVANVHQQRSLQTRQYALTLLGSIAIVALLLYGIYWVFAARNVQKTDDAYVVGDQVQITPQVAGRVIAINADNTELMQAGEVLIQLDPIDAEQALERAKIALANSVRQTQSHRVAQNQLAANVALHRTVLQQAEKDLQRRLALDKKGAIGHEALQHTRQAVEEARLALQISNEQLKADQSLLLHTPLAQQPAVLQSATQLQEAWLMLQRTKIIAPVTGYVARRSVQLGAQVQPGVPLMVIIPLAQMWVDANFKETQLKLIHIGQPATIVTDLYGANIEYQGRVTGIYAGTGSSLSLLPAQNATGNWIKVVQRIPVRIALDSEQVARYPLRVGLSATVTIDTANKSQPKLALRSSRAILSTTPFTLDLTPAKQLITEIIQANVE